MVKGRVPSPEAQQRWRLQEARFRRRMFSMAALTAGGMVLAFVSAKVEILLLAKLGVMAVLGALGWLIYLLVRRQRAFMRIMIEDGLTVEEARQAYLAQSG